MSLCILTPHPDSLVYQALVMVAFLQGGKLVFNDMDDCQPCGDEKCIVSLPASCKTLDTSPKFLDSASLCTNNYFKKEAGTNDATLRSIKPSL